jgi:hypothetical protein
MVAVQRLTQNKGPPVSETTTESLVQRLIVVIKQHRKPSSPKSITVLMKILDKQILQPAGANEAEFKRELQAALDSTAVLSEMIRQQHSEEELRACFRNLLAGLDGVAG